MSRRKWMSAGALAVVLGVAFLAGAALSPSRAMAGSGPEDVVADLAAEVNADDGAGAAALFTADGVFTDISDGGSFAAVGTAALTYILTDTGVQVTLTNVEVDGNEVTAVASTVDEGSEAAGVARYLQPLTAIIEGGKIAEFHLTYDETDAQTRTYLAYQASQEDPDEPLPPGSLTLPLGPGRDGSQTGDLVIFDFDEAPGVVGIGIEIQPGAAGVLQLAHVHEGDCPGVGGIASPLASVLDGFSFTFISMTRAALLAGDFAVNVHKSAAEAAIYVSCGEVEAVAAAPTPAAPVAPAPAATATPGRSGVITAPSTGTGSGDDGVNGMLLIAVFAAVGAVLLGSGAAVRRVR